MWNAWFPWLIWSICQCYKSLFSCSCWIINSCTHVSFQRGMGCSWRLFWCLNIWGLIFFNSFVSLILVFSFSLVRTKNKCINQPIGNVKTAAYNLLILMLIDLQILIVQVVSVLSLEEICMEVMTLFSGYHFSFFFNGWINVSQGFIWLSITKITINNHLISFHLIYPFFFNCY